LLCETTAGWGGGISLGEVLAAELAAELAAASARLAEVEVTATSHWGFSWDLTGILSWFLMGFK